jgi:two-component system sensor histidine kinase YesM
MEGMKQKRKRQLTYNTILLIIFLCIAEIPLLIAALGTNFFVRSYLYEGLETHLEEATAVYTKRIRSALEFETNSIYQLTENPSIGKFFESIEKPSQEELTPIYSMLYLARSGAPNYGINIIRSDGEIISTGTPSPFYDPITNFNWGIIRQARNADKPILFIHDHNHLDSEQRTISIGYAHRNAEGNTDGYVIVDLNKSFFTQLSEEIGGNILVSITNNVGMSCFNSIGYPVQKKLKATDIEAIKGIDGILFFHKESDIAENLTLRALLPLSNTQQVLHSVNIVFKILSMVTALFAIIAAIILAKHISSPISNLVTCVKQIQKGNLAVKSKSNSQISEFSVLSENIDLMGERIKELLRINSEKEQTLRQVQLKYLEAQIHPHFIFNCLTLIQQAIKLNDKEKALDAIVQLGTMIRSSLTDENLVSVEQEMTLVQSYLKLQKYRYGNRLALDIKLDDDTYAIMIPKLSLQPIVENSITHNIDFIAYPLEISIRGYLAPPYLFIDILDNGNGISQEKIAQINEFEKTKKAGNNEHGHGLSNVIHRLRLFYGMECGLTIISKPGQGTFIKIQIKMEALDEWNV